MSQLEQTTQRPGQTHLENLGLSISNSVHAPQEACVFSKFPPNVGQGCQVPLAALSTASGSVFGNVSLLVTQKVLHPFLGGKFFSKENYSPCREKSVGSHASTSFEEDGLYFS